jgi:hypothetical protein
LEVHIDASTLQNRRSVFPIRRQSLSPVSGPSFGVRNRNNKRSVLPVLVENDVREAFQAEEAHIRISVGASEVRKRLNQVKNAGQFNAKFASQPRQFAFVALGDTANFRAGLRVDG